MRLGVDSHPTTHSHETGGVRNSAPSHMGQSPFSSVSSMSMDTTSLNTPVSGSAPASMTVTRDGIEDGIIPILITWIAHLQPKMRLNATRHLESSGTLVNSRFNLNWHLKRTIIILIMVHQLPITSVMVARWGYLLSKYPEPL